MKQEDRARSELIALLRREGQYSGVWFGEKLIEAADALETFATPSPVIETEGGGVPAGDAVREALLPASDWTDKLAELFDWTGSAWLAGEEPENDAQRRGECYSFLCSLIGYLTTAETAAIAAERSTDREAVDGLGRTDADLLRLIARDHERLAPNAHHSAETLRQIADRLALRPVGAENVRDNNALGAGKPEPAGGLRPEPVPVSALSGAHQAQGDGE